MGVAFLKEICLTTEKNERTGHDDVFGDLGRTS